MTVMNLLHTSAQNPVLLIHGIDDTGAVFKVMSAYLKQQGWSVHSLDLIPCNGDAGIEVLAQQIQKYVNRTFSSDQAIDIVGFSMGGIVSRYYVQRLGGINRVQRFITISSPHQGSWAAYFRYNLGAVQMRPHSRFLQDLNRDVQMLDQINFTSIWTPADVMIIPAESSRLPVGKEYIIPVLLHSWMLTSLRIVKLVAQVLTEPIRNSVCNATLSS